MDDDNIQQLCILGSQEALGELLLSSQGEKYIKHSFANGRTILHYACERGFTDIVNLLVNQGVDTEKCDQNNQTPTQIAESHGNHDTANALRVRKPHRGVSFRNLPQEDVKQTRTETPLRSPDRSILASSIVDQSRFVMTPDSEVKNMSKGYIARHFGKHTAKKNVTNLVSTPSPRIIPFGITDCEDLPLVFSTVCDQEVRSSLYSTHLQVLVDTILQQQTSKVNQTSDVLIVIWIFLQLAWTRIAASREAYTAETKKMIKQFLRHAAHNDQLAFPAVKAQLEKHDHLLARLDSLLFGDDLLMQSWSESFVIHFPLWGLQFICLYVQNTNHRKKVPIIRGKKFMESFLGTKHRTWICRILHSLPSGLSSAIIYNVLDYFVAKPDLAKLPTFLSFFNLTRFDLKWLSVLANSLRVDRIKMNVTDLNLWIKTSWEITSMICDDPDVAAGVSLFVVPIMPKILDCPPAEIEQIFQTFQSPNFTDETGRKIVTHSVEDFVLHPHVTPELVVSISKKVVEAYELQPIIISYITMYTRSHRNPTVGIVRILDNLLDGYGLEVLSAIVSSDLGNKNKTELLGLLTILTQIAASCKNYDSHLLITNCDHANSVKDILSFKFSVPNICKILPQLEVTIGELEYIQEAQNYSDLYCLIIKAISEIAVEQILVSSGVEKQALRLNALCDIAWKTEGRSESVSLLKIFTSHYILDIAAASFGEIALELPAKLGDYFTLHSKALSDRHSYALDLYLTARTRFLGMFQEFLKGIFLDGNCNGKELEILQQTHLSLVEFAKQCRLADLHIFDMNKLLGEFTQVHEVAEEMQNVHEWILAKNVTVEFAAPPLVKIHKTLRDLREQLSDYKLSLGLEPEVLAMLVCYVMNRCPLLVFVISDSMPSSNSSKELKFADLQLALKNAHGFIYKMFTDPGWSTQFFENPSILSLAPASVNVNLHQMEKFVKSATQLETQITSLMRGFEVSQFKHSIPQLLECFHYFQLSHAELTVLETWNTNIAHTSPTLVQAPDMLARLKKLVDDLSPLNMAYFQYVRRAPQVVDFFRTQTEFQKKFDLVSSKHQGHAYALGKLNNMFAVFEMLEPFIVFLQDQQKARSHQRLSIASLCSDIQRQFDTVENPSDKLKQILSVAEDFDELLLWFTQLGGFGSEAILPKISHLFQSGFFISSSTKNYSLLKLITKGELIKGKEQDHEYPQAILTDLVRGAKVFVDTNSAPDDQKNHLNGFLECMCLATKIHDQHITLKNLGHPNYQSESLRIPYIGSMDVDRFEQQCYRMLRDETEWSDNIKIIYKSSPRLLMLTKSQLAHFVMQLTKPCHIANYTAYTWACFPDYDISALRGPIIRKCSERFRTFHTSISNPFVRSLEVAGGLVNLIDRDLKETGRQIRFTTGLPEMCLVVNQDSYFMFRLLFSLNASAPHPSAILAIDLSHNIGVREIEAFITKVEKFPQLKYFIVGVNLLLPEPRTLLIKWISSLFVNRATRGTIYLIFTESAGIEAFSFLKCTKYSSQTIDFTQPALNASTVFKARNIAVFECLTGDHGAGKSFYIKSRMQAERAESVLSLSVNEDFSVQTFLQEVQSNMTDEMTLGVHINISAFAPFQRVATFLFNFAVFGILWDEATGEMVALPSNIKWLIFVEIGQTSPNDAQFAHRSSTARVLNELPIAKSLATLVPLESYLQQFPEASYEAQVCYGFICKFNTDIRVPPPVEHLDKILAVAQSMGDILNILTIPDKLKCNWSAVREILRNKNVGIPSEFVCWSTFLSVLKSRCEWLKEYAQYIYNTTLVGAIDNNVTAMKYTSPKNLFELFLKEAGHLSSKQLGNLLTEECPAVLICHSRLGKANTPTLKLLNFAKLPIFDIPCISMQDALDEPSALTNALSLTLGISQSHMTQMISQKEYVLTPGFAAKLCAIHARITAGHNIILSGDTGTGKTELLTIYADLVNSCVPDLLQLLRGHLVSLLIVNDVPRYHVISTYVQRMSENGCWELKATEPALILGCLEQIVHSAPPEFRVKLIGEIVKFVQAMLLEYPLIARDSDILQRVSHPDGFVSDSEFMRLVEAFLKAKFHPVFYRIKMHNRMTSATFKRKVNSIIERTNDFMKVSTSKVVVFVDEFNATSIMGIIKEVFMDHTMDGYPLPSALVWVGAMNPLRKTQTIPETLNFTGVYSEAPDFIVRAHPPSMETLVINISNLSTIQEQNYLRVLLDSNTKINKFKELGCEEKNSMMKWIITSQSFIREAKMHRVSVSIRDIMRTIQVYIFLRSSRGKKVLDLVTRTNGEQSFAGQMTRQVMNKSAATEAKYIALYSHWIALIISIAMSYYFRLPAQQPKNSKIRQSRDLFDKQCNDFLKGHANPTVLPNFFNFGDTITTLIQNFFSATAIPAGIAPTNSLKENLFCTVMCIEMKIPLIIIGPPGCAKTLSFSIAVDNMKGKHSQKPFYTSFHSVHVYRYQCSEHSTDVELREVYKSAIKRQKKFAENSSHRSVVLLDEAGLPNEIDMPLKALHYHLDHPVVPTVILSNKMLDAAKTNRSLQLLQSPVSLSDLRTLAIGCISKLLQNDGEDIQYKDEFADCGVLDSLCAAYLSCQKFSDPTRKEFFHLRDFVYFLRFLGLRATRGNKFELTASVLLDGLQRNFNGIPHAHFEKLVHEFFSKMSSSWGRPETVPGYHDTFVEIMKRSLQEHHAVELNYFHTRYIMAIDPTDNETAIWLLFALGICHRENTLVCYSADFANDTSEITQCEVILKVKNAMEAGETVIMINSHSINSCFYDVFNCYFDVITGLDGKPQRFANLAVGSYSHQCKVHENFKIILHVPASSLHQVPLPLLNRFEKYFVSMEHALKYTLKDFPKVNDSVSVFEAISDGCEDFVSQVHTYQSQSRLLYGFVAKETISSLVFDIAMRSKRLKSSYPEIPTSFRLNNSIAADAKTINNSMNLRTLIKRANFHLLQLARPEYVFFCRQLPTTYVTEYMLEQEHLSFIRFFHHAFVGSSIDPMKFSPPRKWCVFTRTSGELIRVCSDEKLQTLFVPPRELVESVLQDNDGAVMKEIRFFELSSVQSLASCRMQIEKLAKNARALVCVANMDVCTVSQVNVCRHFISTYLSAKSETLVTLVLHYPPEMNISDQPNYHAIYVDGWNFVYIDSLGVSTGHENNIGVLDVDARSWLAKGFGLPIEIQQDSLVEPFSNRFFQNLRQCCMDMVIHPSTCKLSHSQLFYAHTDPETRFKFLKDIFSRFPFMLKEILNNFSKIWTPSLLYSILSTECEQLQLGRTTSSLLHRMHAAIRGTLFPLVVRVTRAICSNYALEAIASCGTDAENQELLRLVFKTFTPPPLSDILNQNLDHIVVVQSQFPFPSRTILFDVLSEKLLTLLRIAKFESEDNEELLRGKFKHLAKNSPIWSAAYFINTHPKLFTTFKHDFVMRTLQLPQIKDGWLDLCLTFLDKLQCGSDLFDLYLSVFFKGNQLSSLGVLLHPLLDLKDPEDFIGSITKRFNRFDFDPKEHGKISTALLELSVDSLWKRLLQLCAGEGTGLVGNWMQVFHQFHMQYPLHNSLLGILSESDLLHLDIMTIVFYFFTSADQYSFQGANDAIKKANASNKNTYMGLSHFVPLINSLSTSSRLAVPEIVTFLQEVTIYFLKVKTGDLRPERSDHLVRDFETILQLWANPGRSYWSAVPVLWKTWTIFGLLQNRNICDRLYTEVYTFIKSNHPNFSYTAKLLNEKHLPKSQVSQSNSFIADAVFFSLLQSNWQDYHAKSLEQLCELYTSSQPNTSEVRGTLETIVIVTIILRKLATTLGAEPYTKFGEKTASICKQILADTPGADLYIFQQIRPLANLCKLVASDELSQLGMEKWKVSDSLLVHKFYLFSFMIEDQTELGKFYAHTKRSIAQGILLQSIRANLGVSDHADSVRYKYRMCIFLVCYYEYFNHLKKCTVLLDLLDNVQFLHLLDIDSQEKLVFKMVSEAPKNWEMADPLMYQFSAKAREDEDDCSIAHVMVNCMAVALGSPFDSNHIYVRALDIKQAASSFSPGSNLERKMVDSGYLVQSDGTLKPSNIMGDHTPYRLVLNTLMWASFSWGSVIDPTNGPRACKSIDNFLTNWAEDGKIRFGECATPLRIFDFIRNRNEAEKIRYYMMIRTHRFFNMFTNNSEFLEQHIDGMHFITESLLQIWKEINNNGNPSQRHPAWRSIYKTQTEAIEYEDILKQTIFDTVHLNYNTLKDIYQKVAEQNSSLQEIFSVQNSQARRFESPIISFDIFHTYVADQIGLAKKGGAQEIAKMASLNLVSYFMRERNKLRVLKHLPTLTQFYKLLHSALAFKVTLEEAQELTVPTCLERFGIEMFIYKEWPEFKEAWKEIREAYKEDEGCPDQMLHRLFESELLVVDDSTLLTRMLSHADLDENDEVYRVISLMTKTQDDVLMYKDQYRNQTTHQLNLEHLSAHSVQDLIVMGNYAVSDFEEYVMSQMTLDSNHSRSSVSFDITKIAHHIAEKVLFGKVSFNCNNFRTPFHFKKSEEIDYNDHKFSVSTGAKLLRLQAEKIQSTPYDRALDNEQLLVARHNFNTCNENELDSLVELLSSLIKKVIEKDTVFTDPDENGQFVTLPLQTAVADFLKLETLPVLKGNFLLANLHQLSVMAADMVREERALFRDSLAMEPVSPETEKAFTGFEHKLLSAKTSHEDIETWLAFLGRVIRMLLDARETLRRHQPPTDTVAKVFSNQIKSIAKEFSGPVNKNWETAVPSGLLITQVRTYILFLYRLCGDLLKKNKPETSLLPYNEKVPESFGAPQNPNVAVSIPSKEVDESTQPASPQTILFVPAVLPAQPAPVYFSSRSSSLSSRSSEITLHNSQTELPTHAMQANKDYMDKQAPHLLAQQTLSDTTGVRLEKSDSFTHKPQSTSTRVQTNTNASDVVGTKDDVSTDPTDESSLRDSVTDNSEFYNTASGRAPDPPSNIKFHSPNSNNASSNNNNTNSNTNTNNDGASDKKPPPPNKKLEPKRLPLDQKGLILVVVEYFDGIVFKYKPARDFAATALYDKVVSDVKKKKIVPVPFHLRSKLEQVILPNSPDHKLSFCIPPDTETQITLEACPGSAICVHILYEHKTNEYYFDPATPSSHLYAEAQEQHALAPGKFTLVWQAGVFPDSDSISIGAHIPLNHQPPVKLVVQEGVQICVALPNATIMLCEPAESPLALLFPQIVPQLTSDYDFYLSPDRLQLISPDSDKPIRSVLGTNPSTVELFLVKADSVIRVKIFIGPETINTLGVPLGASMGQLWQIIDEFYPDMVAFPRDYLYARRAVDAFDEAHMDTDLVSIWAKDFELFVDLIPKSSAIFTSFCIDNTLTEAICAHPDLALGELLELVTKADSSMEYVDPEGVEIDLFGDAITASIFEYADLMRRNGFSAECFEFQATSSPVLRFVVHADGRDHMFNYEDDGQLTTAGLIEIMHESLPDLDSEGCVFCAGEIALITDGDLAAQVKHHTLLSVAKESSLISVAIELRDPTGDASQILKKVTPSVTPHQIATALSLAPSTSLFSKGFELPRDLPLSSAFGFCADQAGAVEGEKLSKMELIGRESEDEEVLDLTLIWQDHEAKFSLLAETTFEALADYARFIFKIEAGQNIEFFDTEGFQLMVSTIGENGGGTLVVSVEDDPAE